MLYLRFRSGCTGTAYARFFNPTVGLWEDSATGTAAGPLCAYLGASGMLGQDNTLVIEQGTLMGRPSMYTCASRPMRSFPAAASSFCAANSSFKSATSPCLCRSP